MAQTRGLMRTTHRVILILKQASSRAMRQKTLAQKMATTTAVPNQMMERILFSCISDSWTTVQRTSQNYVWVHLDLVIRVFRHLFLSLFLARTFGLFFCPLNVHVLPTTGFAFRKFRVLSTKFWLIPSSQKRMNWSWPFAPAAQQCRWLSSLDVEEVKYKWPTRRLFHSRKAAPN